MVQSQQSGGLLLPPVQTLVATLIFAHLGENANDSRTGRFIYRSPLVSSFFIQAAGLVYHHRAKRGAYHQPYGLYIITL